uniref:Bile acid:sodium symporter n=1 Tax=Corethron hystrix TaxID=216773 RepID=A0A7S1BHR8_9STRA|mmetsp:Transcript_28721/g.65631  ORF Transcript_28721/g.65631 Transcript_28721/m.65631 type:complete len:322 (+) Transcript_28721:186-1151(+)
MKSFLSGAAIVAVATMPTTEAFVSPSIHTRHVEVLSSTSMGMRLKSGSRNRSALTSRVYLSTKLAMSSTALDTSDAETTFGSKLFATYIRAASIATTLFPLWTVLFTGMALKSPSSFAWFTTEYFTAALAALMLSMGITLKPEDFAKVAKRPNSVFIQFALCYAMMPLLALFLGKACGLDSALLAGVVLVGSINGGQASNLCTYIAKGNVALSVLMTTATTLGAIFMTPLLCKTLLGAIVPVDAVGIAMSTIQVVLAPIAVGMFLNKNFPKVVKAILPFAPVVGVVSTCLLVASAVAQVAEPIRNAGMSLQVSSPTAILYL